MYLVQLLLPLYDNEGHAFEASEYVRLRAELADRFGGVTAYTRAPARGVWKDDSGETTQRRYRDFRSDDDRSGSRLVDRFRKELEDRFRQDTLIVRALTYYSL